MQRFHETTDPHAATTPLYDSETVREVLARASQIEQETHTDAPMTAAQIEALGKEVGLSPDAVRRALGEKVGTAPVTNATRKTVSSPRILTRQTVAQVYFPMLLFLIATIPVVLFILTVTKQTPLIGTLWLGISMLVLAFCLSARRGWITQSVGMAWVSAIFMFAYAVVHRLAHELHFGRMEAWTPNLWGLVAIVATVAFVLDGSAALVRGWFEKLPKNVGDDAASDR